MNIRGAVRRLDSLDDRVFRKRTGWTPHSSRGRVVLGGLSGLVAASSLWLGLIGFVVGGALLAAGIASMRAWERRYPAQPVTFLATPPPSDVAACAVGPTHTEIVSRRRKRWLLSAFGVALSACFVLIAVASQSHDDHLDKSGGRVSGVVTAFGDLSHVDGDGRLHVDYVVGQHHYSGSVQLDDGSPRFHLGQHVTVEYDRRDPAVMTLPGQDNESSWIVTVSALALVGAVVAYAAAAVLLRRARQRGRILRAVPWRLGNLDNRYQARLIVDGEPFFLPRWFSIPPSFTPGPIWKAAGHDGLAVIASTNGTLATLVKSARSDSPVPIETTD